MKIIIPYNHREYHTNKSEKTNFGISHNCSVYLSLYSSRKYITLSIALTSTHDFDSKSSNNLSQASLVIPSTVDFLVSYKADDPIKHFPVSATSLKTNQQPLENYTTN